MPFADVRSTCRNGRDGRKFTGIEMAILKLFSRNGFD